MSSSAELNPLFVPVSTASASDMRGNVSGRHARRRGNVFHRESTRLRSNVADQVQRDLLPAGRMLSVFLVLCELFAEIAVLFATRHQKCDRPLRFWVAVLIVLQSGTVFLNCLNIWTGRDAFSPHRNGLSATDPDMYHGARGYSGLSVATSGASSSPPAPATTATAVHIPLAAEQATGRDDDGMQTVRDCPQPAGDDIQIRQTYAMDARHDASRSSSSSSSSSFLPGATMGAREARGRTEFLDHYVRVVNAIYLIWYIIGSVWVSGGGTCHATAPHLYRLTVALTIIYYALLFLPLACFCLIVCCLPLFILVYRIMLPYAERERRRARAADPSLVQSLSSVSYSPGNFQNLTASDNLDDASCVICLCDYEQGEQIRFLPCKHHFHQDCVDVWLQLDKACCLCKQDIDSQNNSTASAV